MDVVARIAALGGITFTQRAIAAGCGPDAIRRAVIRGEIVRPRRGVLAVPDCAPAILSAARNGGSLAGPSAASYWGMWVPDTTIPFISVRRDFDATRMPAGTVALRDAHRLAAHEVFVVSPWTAVRQCIRLLPFDHAVALVDSALNGRGGPPAVHRSALDEWRRVLPRRLHPVLDAVDARSESGAESIARVRLRSVGLDVEPPVTVISGIRVDLLVGDRLVVEVGSRSFHANGDRYEPDHDRAATLLALGFDYLEFTTNQVMHDWDTVESIVIRLFNQQSDPTRRQFESTRRAAARIAG